VTRLTRSVGIDEKSLHRERFFDEDHERSEIVGDRVALDVAAM
jgi:hypothetical protein